MARNGLVTSSSLFLFVRVKGICECSKNLNKIKHRLNLSVKQLTLYKGFERTMGLYNCKTNTELLILNKTLPHQNTGIKLIKYFSSQVSRLCSLQILEQRMKRR